MKLNPIALLVFMSCAGLAAGQTITDPAHIEVYVTPYYNSKGPAIEVGPFGSGLAAKNEPEFIATIEKMKASWDTLNFAETYVAAIRLYDLGFRKESIYLFYSAQYRGRLFASLIDRDKMGSHRRSRVRTVPGAERLPTVARPVHQRICIWRHRSVDPDH
jgi:hypothetical protein